VDGAGGGPDADLSGGPDDAGRRAEPARPWLEIPLQQAAVRRLPAAGAVPGEAAVAASPDGDQERLRGGVPGSAGQGTNAGLRGGATAAPGHGTQVGGVGASP